MLRLRDRLIKSPSRVSADVVTACCWCLQWNRVSLFILFRLFHSGTILWTNSASYAPA